MLGIITILRCQKFALSPIYESIRYLHKERIPVKWEKPVIGSIKLNFDGSSKIGKASIGGVVRDHNAKFKLGYAGSIGEATSTIAEVVALRRGLELVLEKGLNEDDILIEGDDKTLIEIINQRKEVGSNEFRDHIKHIYSMLPEFKNCKVSHIYREGNRTAHKFAQMGYQFHKIETWTYVPPQVSAIFEEEAQGKTVFRKK